MTDDLTARCLAEINRRLGGATDLGFRPEHHRDWPYLAAFRAILDLHKRYVVPANLADAGAYCNHDDDAWPCQTVRAVATALGVEP